MLSFINHCVFAWGFESVAGDVAYDELDLDWHGTKLIKNTVKSACASESGFALGGQQRVIKKYDEGKVYLPVDGSPSPLVTLFQLMCARYKDFPPYLSKTAYVSLLYAKTTAALYTIRYECTDTPGMYMYRYRCTELSHTANGSQRQNCDAGAPHGRRQRPHTNLRVRFACA